MSLQWLQGLARSVSSMEEGELKVALSKLPDPLSYLSCGLEVSKIWDALCGP